MSTFKNLPTLYTDVEFISKLRLYWKIWVGCPLKKSKKKFTKNFQKILFLTNFGADTLNLGEKSEHILTTSELLGFNCAYVTCDIAIRPEDEEQSLLDLGVLSSELGPILKNIICAKPPLVLDHCQLTPQARLSTYMSSKLLKINFFRRIFAFFAKNLLFWTTWM